MLSKILALAAAAGGAAIGSAAAAQVDGEATLYSSSHFKGFSLSLSDPRQSIDALVVKSIQMAPGSAWDLCSGNTFTGCKRFSQSTSSMVMTVRSARPVAPATAGVSSGAGVTGSGASLRGLASEFFAMPAESGARVEVSATAAGALPQRATEFCRTHGWRTSAYQRVQAVGGRDYLADVLCVDENR